MDELRYHECYRSESWEEYDGNGIYLCRVCCRCREAKLAGYRPEILRPYTQADVDEPIEPDGDW
jgi:hypothetical protein